MNELQRLAYLQAMEIDSYVSRVALPAAAPSRRLRIVRRAAAEKPAVAELKASLETPPAAAAQDPSPPDGTVSGSAAADIPIFSVAAANLGGWYWLDEIPAGRTLGPEYTQLLQAICFALGLATANPVVEQFNWPLNHSSHLDHSDEAARGGFGGFLMRRLEQFQPSGVVLLGNFDVAWFDRGLLEDLPVVTTVSAWQMLRQPALKARAWADLQALRSDEA